MAHPVPPKRVRRRAEFLIDNIGELFAFWGICIEHALEEDEEERGVDQALIAKSGVEIRRMPMSRRVVF
jgi:hypothetical protein